MSIDYLQNKIRRMKCPIAMELGVLPEKLPPHLLHEALAAHDTPLGAAADALHRFCVALIDGLYDIIPAVIVKPAYFMQLGPDGAAALSRTILYAREKGLYLLIDTRFCELDESAWTYAKGYLGTVSVGSGTAEPYGADGITVLPYLGSDGILPFAEYCGSADKSVFVLAKTQNKSSYEVQDMVAGDRLLYQVVCSMVERIGKPYPGRYGFSNVAVIVGASHPRYIHELRERHPTLFFLLTGYDSDDGSPPGRDIAHEVEKAFGPEGRGALISLSNAAASAWITMGDDGRRFVELARDRVLSLHRALKQAVFIA